MSMFCSYKLLFKLKSSHFQSPPFGAKSSKSSHFQSPPFGARVLRVAHFFRSLSLAYFSVFNTVGWFERLCHGEGYRTQVYVRVITLPFSGFILAVQVTTHPLNVVGE